ncbi:MAG: hypothetical protein E7063_07305 [Spirochaetaceae bacterium]|nr:hypothetical protein [Spirochaetaceae bacterium]
MLKLLVRDLDICRVSKLLGKNRLKASITGSSIIIDSDEITDEVIDNLFENATIFSAQNYHTSDAATSMDTETNVEEKDTSVDVPSQVAETTDVAVDTVTSETVTDTPVNADTVTSEAVTNTPVVADAVKSEEMAKNEFSTETPKSAVAYSDEPIEQSDETIDSEYHVENSTDLVTQEDVEVEQPKSSRSKIPKSEMVYRGEVYKWGSVRDKDDGEGKIKECVIIIQNDYQMSASDDTIALFCTSHYEERAPIQFSFALTEGTMVDHSVNRLELFDRCTMFVGHIKGISRKQLGKYLGTMTDSFMNTLQPTIDFCLGLKRSRTVNWAQLQMLSTIDMADMFAIAESKVSNSQKVTEFLKLFHFDMSQNGMEYVKKAILVASTLGDYRLEDLVQLIAKKEQVEASEVLRLIVARIKENFHFKKSPAISFIRLIDKLLRKGREIYGFKVENYSKGRR